LGSLLGYDEFLNFNKLENNDQSLQSYLTVGGMPYQYHIGIDSAIVFEYLKNVYSSILLKDVVSRESIRNVPMLENLVSYLADNIGSLFSAQNISKHLKSQKINIPTQTVINYLHALSSAFFIHRVPRAEINGMKILEIGEKYYFEDLGLRNSIRGVNMPRDIGKLMENTVFLYLMRLGYHVFIGKEGDKEIDFLCERRGERLYVQVCYLLASEQTIQREFGNLMAIEDNYPKYVVSMDTFNSPNTFKGIHHVSLRSFLLMEL